MCKQPELKDREFKSYQLQQENRLIRWCIWIGLTLNINRPAIDLKKWELRVRDTHKFS